MLSARFQGVDLLQRHIRKLDRLMRLTAVLLQLRQAGVDLFFLAIALGAVEQFIERHLEGHKFIPQLSNPARRGSIRRVLKLLIPLQCLSQDAVQSVFERIVAHPF